MSDTPRGGIHQSRVACHRELFLKLTLRHLAAMGLTPSAQSVFAAGQGRNGQEREDSMQQANVTWTNDWRAPDPVRRLGRSGFAGLVFLILSATSALADMTAAGQWEQVDDKTGRVKSTITIAQSGGVFVGRVTQIFPEPGHPTDPKCDKCAGAAKGQPIKGLQIIEGLKQSGLDYSDGTILDPESGSVYSAQMQLSPDGRHLTVRGYIGISALGRSQVWNRLR
jgi:uncharacterized protein (DUF2147 family)